MAAYIVTDKNGRDMLINKNHKPLWERKELEHIKSMRSFRIKGGHTNEQTTK